MVAAHTPASKVTILLFAACFLGVLLAYQLWPEPQLDPSAHVDRVVVEKGKRKMALLQNGRVLKTYKVSLGGHPAGTKTQQGDGKTPEGTYVLDWRNPRSKFHLSVHISYPDAQDVQAARAAGIVPGGEIMVHGLQNGLGWIGRLHRFYDWTDGCVAVTNAEMDEIWRAVPDGTPIEIRP